MIKRIVVAGLGKLGAPIAAAFAQAGVAVYGYDSDESKVQAIRHHLAPVAEPGLEEAIIKAQGSEVNLWATTDAKTAMADAEACIFVMPTPSLKAGNFDNFYLLDVLRNLGEHIPAAEYPFYFIITSTVTPGSCEHVFLPAIRRICSRPFYLIYKPELIALGTVLRDLRDPDMAIFGGSSSIAIGEVQKLYRKIAPSCPMHCMSYVEAELAKISLNCAVTMKISFANQLGMVAEKLGANPDRILEAIGDDRRIGKHALKPGLSFGGPCFPRDNRMFQFVAEQVGVSPHLAAATDQINEDILGYIEKQIPVHGSVGILGLAYKAGTPIMEESAGYKLRQRLLEKNRMVMAHDPLAGDPLGLVGFESLKNVLACRTVIVTINAPEYRELRFSPATTLIDPMHVTQGVCVGEA